jgi:DNA-binding transcriptional regulator YiaG
MKPRTYKTSFEVCLPGTGNTPPRPVESIEVEVFEEFGEEFLTPESMRTVENIKARHLGLMTGEDIKAMRKRLGLTQKEMTELLDCGEKSLSRWENGHGYPTGIVNKMLRLLDEGFLSPSDLRAVGGPRSELASERFLRNRSQNVAPVDFKAGRCLFPEPTDSDEELLQPAANS